jgi:Calcineurin-like phosphoesterase
VRILVIPDTQVAPGVPTQHMTWIGRAIMDYRPDVVVHLGDHWDMHSLSSYSSRKEAENQRYLADVESGNEAMRLLLAPLHRSRADYNPRMVFLLGNHCDRVTRAVNEHPYLEGWMGFDEFYLEDWEVVPFKQPIEIGGILFCHYFYAMNSGRAYGGTALSKLKNIGCSFVMGHQQGFDYAQRQLANGTMQHGLVAGSCYLHDEDYRGPQANGEWRGIVILNDVHAGDFDVMPLRMNYLERKYG